MNRNFTSELAKIKVLNLSGETQEKFEKWRRRWENIVATDLSDIEEALFDAEEAADRFRFPKANKTLNALEETLEKVEEDRKSTRLNSSHVAISYAVFCLKKKK